MLRLSNVKMIGGFELANQRLRICQVSLSSINYICVFPQYINQWARASELMVYFYWKNGSVN